MRVVQLLPELNEGGVERGVVELSRELVRRGIDSWVLCAGGRLAEQIEKDGGHHRAIDLAGKNPLTAWSRARALRRLLRQIAPDLIHARSRVPAWLAVMANRSLRIPFVTTVHGFNSVNAYSRVMTCGDRVICVSGAIKEYIQSHYRVPDEKIVVIPRGVDLDLFDPARLDAGFMEEFRSAYDLQGKFVVTSVGRITQLKDYETFIAALVMAGKEIPDLVGLIVGGVHEDRKDYFARLQQQVAAAGAGDFIQFAGSQSKVAEIYALSSVVVSSSKKPESFGRTAAEALAMGVPVVAAGHGGILDIVRDGETGLLFPPGDANALADRILQARSQTFPGLREFVTENFSLEMMVSRTIAVYRELSKGRGCAEQNRGVTMARPMVSFIVPVYNKSRALTATLNSLLNQKGPFDAEFIFIDDASTDNSVEILERNPDPRIQVLKNADNRGPAIRLNQGARAARGDYLQFVDGDDVLVRGATAEMLRILQEEKADVIYGKWRMTQEPAENLLDESLTAGESYTVSEQPLHYVLTHSRIVRMVAMTTRSCFLESGGCDETVFVQDESLPLRLAWKARRFVDFSGAVILVPAHDGGNLSQNKVQQHHDGFCVFRNALADLEGIDDRCRRLLNGKAVSIAWKHYRRNMKGSLLSSLSLQYALSKICSPMPQNGKFAKLYELFDGFSGKIRKPGSGSK